MRAPSGDSRMNVTVRFFARAKDLAGVDQVEVNLDEPVTVGDLRQRLLQKYPQLAPMASVLLVAVNSMYANDPTMLVNGVEVAVFPPVSGG
jgi:molybdopterin converting factor subunit 1